MSEQQFSYELTVDSIRSYIKQELNGKHLPQRKTVKAWLKEFGQEGIHKRIDQHLSYWKPRLTQTSNISSSIDRRKACAPTIIPVHTIPVIILILKIF